MLLVGDGVKSQSTAYQPVSGTNKSEGHDAVIILGRDEPSVRDAEQRAMAIWYDTKKPIRRIDADLKGLVNYRTRERAYVVRDRSKEYAKDDVFETTPITSVLFSSRKSREP